MGYQHHTDGDAAYPVKLRNACTQIETGFPHAAALPHGHGRLFTAVKARLIALPSKTKTVFRCALGLRNLFFAPGFLFHMIRIMSKVRENILGSRRMGARLKRENGRKS